MQATPPEPASLSGPGPVPPSSDPEPEAQWGRAAQRLPDRTLRPPGEDGGLTDP